MWVKFSERKPKEGILITRFTPWSKQGHAFETWRLWENDYLRTMTGFTHWWDGEYNFDLALENWEKNEEK